MSPDLRQLYDEHAPALFAFLLNFTRREADARDTLQELFLKLIARPQLLTGVQNTRAFLLRLAHRLAIDTHRRSTVREAAIERAAAEPVALFHSATDPDEGAFRSALAEALAELPAEQRAVVHLKLWEQMTFAEIAEALDIPANTAASRYRYGIDKLQALLRPLYEELR
ncbi:RNA polymerase, sigma-24 subunit, ECF subfamily [Chthoniobacter flavus Ellin428]|uniref:RNA polymerase, sigma-24 subunit, ECF subfamily n=1 Tax=Chthoniobacter flavus Ellin428 TaxID=497964 RepID=B4CTU7_9BACT|nr:sigma-70 family RNA polymerase sigma factor [Chthoniobacter flavus]EDY21985.1 RNA polymerase, sigma-24 subunit, ECF subfamily [Chthoniobacter flavus Ellin428]TCO89372.1 RNA polymerase sigma-70 factor (ECF subfamily) [Chthoniobacter flavus]